MEFKKKKISDENVKVVLEDMCVLGSIYSYKGSNKKRK